MRHGGEVLQLGALQLRTHPCGVRAVLAHKGVQVPRQPLALAPFALGRRHVKERQRIPGRRSRAIGIVCGRHLRVLWVLGMPFLHQPHHGFAQLVDVKGLGDKGVHAALQGGVVLVLQRTGRERDHRQLRERRDQTHLARGLVAVHDRHLHIHQHHIERGRPAAQANQCLGAIAGHSHLGTFARQNVKRDIAVDFAVVHHQNPHAGQALRDPVVRLALGQ